MNSITRKEAKLEVGRGWSKLIDKVYDRLPKEAFVAQVKEKFGGLRIYVDNIDNTMWDFLINIENESLTICEICGNPGTPRGGGWIKTLCQEHRNEYQQGTKKP